MKYLSVFLIIILNSCFPSMQVGPDPHSIPFKEENFERILNYCKKNPQNSKFNFEYNEFPENMPKIIINDIKESKILSYRHFNNLHIFYCGYGVVGKGWGFIYGEFSKEDESEPPYLKINNESLYLTFLEKINGKWYRFGSN